MALDAKGLWLKGIWRYQRGMSLFETFAQRLWGRSAPLTPAQPFCAVGDLHGRADLLAQLPTALAKCGWQNLPVIFLGDYIDRGPESAAVLNLLKSWQDATPEQIVCLMGNHEQMLLEVLDRPEKAPRWLSHGGAETLESFGIVPPPRPQDLSENALQALIEGLKQCLGGDLISWLRALPLSWRSGNVVLTHAGANPRRPFDQQSEQDLIWGSRDFLHRRRRDGVWVVHGHWIMDAPHKQGGRIAVDTGAYATGRLTCACIAENDVSYLTITA